MSPASSAVSVSPEALTIPATSADTLAVAIRPVTVAVSLKHSGDYRRQPLMATSLEMDRLSGAFITEPKNLSLVVPNMLHADYGARMTGSIYVRGLGSRIDQPAVGLYLDGVPVINKNNYDFDYFDLRRIDVLRGPQGTLYGRNTIGGVIDVQTLSPFDFQGVRFGAGYANAGTWQARASVYRRPTSDFGWSLSGSHRYSDGFFTNSFDGSAADRGSSSALRFKIQARLGGGWTLDNSLHAGSVSQRGFAYAPFDESIGTVGAISHSDPCSYDRLSIIEGLTFRLRAATWRFSSTTGYQFTDDVMALDNDFSPASLFTLRQKQREHAFTQEFTARSSTSRSWQWIAGFFGFHRSLAMSAPVTFKHDGIRELIEANSGMDIRQESFLIDSRFGMPASGAALYHQSTWSFGLWSLIAGLRADLEYSRIDYRNSMSVDFRFADAGPWWPLAVTLDDTRRRTFFELMPRLALTRSLAFGTVYASLSRGYKAGGFNTQIFSDIVRQKMTSPSYDPGDAIVYDPERSWNYEIGVHLGGSGNGGWADGRLNLDAALFYIDCRNQQLTIFPPGNGTGRMMSNAGRTRSFGAEFTASYRVGEGLVQASFGHADARFVRYTDGQADYAGNRVPYAPANTLSVQGEWGFAFGGGRLVLGIGAQGVGRIWWNESNTLSQPFYTLFNASVGWHSDRLHLSVWSRNLTDTAHNTFYFKSVGRSFVQRGKPAQCGITLFYTI